MNVYNMNATVQIPMQITITNIDQQIYNNFTKIDYKNKNK